MTSDADLVELTTAMTAIEAEWIVGALKGLGIVAVTFGDQLADEYAMSQKLMGSSGGVRVMVQRGELERAREALVAIKQDRPSQQELEAALSQAEGAVFADVPEDREPRPSGKGTATAVIVILGLVVAVLGWLAVSQHRELADQDRARQRAAQRRTVGRWETRWSDNDKLAAVYLDSDRTGGWEERWIYDRAGSLFAKGYDENENEFWEVKAATTEDGAEVYRHVDANENGVIELKVYAPMDGAVQRWIDADEDGRYERYEFVDPDTGEILDAFVDRGRDGFVRVK